jgi:GMP synthase-like glutamine amidotransferase
MSAPTILFIQNYATDPPHLVGRWLMEIGFEVEIIRAYDGEVIPTELPKHVKGVIALGGAMGALDDHLHSWLAPERALLKKVVSEDVPVIGICLGAQLLGAAIGGEIARLNQNEIGIYEITQVAEDSIMSVGPTALSTQWHEDYVSVLPEGATLVAKSEACPTQIYRVGELTYGLQFHPEADGSIVALWENKPDNAFKNFEKNGIESTVAETVKASESDLELVWKPLIQKWGREVLARSIG